MISVPYTFQKTFHYEINQGKNVDVQWGTDSTVYRKYPSLAKNQDDQCSSPDTADHPSFRIWFGKFSDTMEKNK